MCGRTVILRCWVPMVPFETSQGVEMTMGVAKVCGAGPLRQERLSVDWGGGAPVKAAGV